MITVKIEGGEKLAKKFGEASAQMEKAIDQGVMNFGQYARRYFKSRGYPAQIHRSLPFMSDAQRRLLHSGAIGIPYRRRGVLASSFYSRRVSSMTVEIGNSAEHAPGVIGDKQWYAHTGNWWQFNKEFRTIQSRLPFEVELSILDNIVKLIG